MAGIKSAVVESFPGIEQNEWIRCGEREMCVVLFSKEKMQPVTSRGIIAVEM